MTSIQLVSESGVVSHAYHYDSIDNRVSKDSSPYHLSRLNQVLDDTECTYRYDLNGNLPAKELWRTNYTV